MGKSQRGLLFPGCLGQNRSLRGEMCTRWPPEMPGLLRGLYWCPARLQGKLELSRHFLQEAFPIKKLSFQYVTLLVIYLPIYLCLSIHWVFFCQEHLNKTCSYSHHDSKQSTQLNWLKIFCCESFQHEIEFPPGRSPLGMAAGPCCVAAAPASTGTAMGEMQHGQGTTEPNEGIELPHPIFHYTITTEEAHSPSSSVPSSLISSISISTAIDTGIILWQVIVFPISSPFGKWGNVKMPYFLQALVSNEHLNDPKLCCQQWGTLRSLFLIYSLKAISPHIKLSRSLDLCLKLNLII